MYIYKEHNNGSIILLKNLRSAAGILPVSMHGPPASDPRAHSPLKCSQGRQLSLSVSIHLVLSSILPLLALHHPPLCVPTLLALSYTEPNSALSFLSSEGDKLTPRGTHFSPYVFLFLPNPPSLASVLTVLSLRITVTKFSAHVSGKQCQKGIRRDSDVQRCPDICVWGFRHCPSLEFLKHCSKSSSKPVVLPHDEPPGACIRNTRK